MSKQKLLDSWVIKGKAQKTLKQISDDRSVLLERPAESLNVCVICGDSGSVLDCGTCLKKYHLVCVNLSLDDLPISEWTCLACVESRERFFVSLLENNIQGQRQTKKNTAKKHLKDVNGVYENRKVSKFQQKHPGLVKEGNIQYPIDDAILWENSKLHLVQKKDFPKLHFSDCPDTLKELIFVSDFCWKFKEFLKSPDFDCEKLHKSLSQNSEDNLSKLLHICLVKPLAYMMLKSESFRKFSSFQFFVYKLKKVVSVDVILEDAYLVFIKELFKIEEFQDIISDFDKEMKNFFFNFDICQYHLLSPSHKLKVLNLIIVLLLETKELNEECIQRHEIQAQLKKELGEYLKSKTARQENLEEKIKETENRLKQASVRTNRLGQDRDFNEYYFFDWDNKLYVNLAVTEFSSWGYYRTREEVQYLAGCLSEKGVREGELYERLQDLLEYEGILDDIEDTEMVQLDSSNLYKEEGLLDMKDTEMTQVGSNSQTIEDIIPTLKQLYQDIAECLDLNLSEKILKGLENTNFTNVTSRLLEFHLALTRTPIPKEKKTILESFWDSCDLFCAWEKAVNDLRNEVELRVCLRLLKMQVKDFCERNRKRKVNEYFEARKMYNFERFKRLKKGRKVWEENCFVCDGAGLVVCCEKCPKVAHLECVGLESIPECEWVCSVCLDEVDRMRVTRSKGLMI